MKNIYQRIKQSITIGEYYRHKGLEFDSRIDSQGGLFRCQIHGQDRHPSAFYYPATKSMFCYACKFGGDIVEVVKKIEKLSNAGEAVQYLLTNFHEKNLAPVSDNQSMMTKWGDLYTIRARNEIFEAIGNYVWDRVDETDNLSLIQQYKKFIEEFAKCEDMDEILSEFDRRF